MNGVSVFMAKFKFTGIEAYTASLEKIGGKSAVGVLKYAVYPGAAVVADQERIRKPQGHGGSAKITYIGNHAER